MEQRPKFCPRSYHASSGNGDELVGNSLIDSPTLEEKKEGVFLGGVCVGVGGDRGSRAVPTAQAVFLSYFSPRGTNTYLTISL